MMSELWMVLRVSDASWQFQKMFSCEMRALYGLCLTVIHLV